MLPQLPLLPLLPVLGAPKLALQPLLTKAPLLRHAEVAPFFRIQLGPKLSWTKCGWMGRPLCG